MDTVSESTFLEFTSWWTETSPVKSSRRYVYIKYNILDGTFAVTLDSDTNTYFIPTIYNQKTGEPVLVWDLYVGVELDILGRRTTLHQCSNTTSLWNVYWKKKLLPIKELLLKELSKYSTAKLEPYILRPPAKHCNLRSLMSQISLLQDRLAEFRPRKANLLGVPLEMYEIEHIRSEGGRDSFMPHLEDKSEAA